ncbi:MAG TPA: pullulanase [Bacillus bacterium]|nr:pullulanase [Bacillus sp. (in: firmicutes)]
MEITGHTAELLDDPFGLLEGSRYEFYLDIEVDEEDELYSEKGLALKVIFLVNGNENRILQNYFIEQDSEKVLDFDLEDDEVEQVTAYCIQNLPGDEEETDKQKEQ